MRYDRAKVWAGDLVHLFLVPDRTHERACQFSTRYGVMPYHGRTDRSGGNGLDSRRIGSMTVIS